jgi:hypothetical protein
MNTANKLKKYLNISMLQIIDSIGVTLTWRICDGGAIQSGQPLEASSSGF